MICPRCGVVLPDGSAVCPRCDAVLAPAPQADPYGERSANAMPGNPAPPPPPYPYGGQHPYTYGMLGTPEERSAASSLLTFGILAMAFAVTVYFSFLSIIFGAMGLFKASNYTRTWAPLSGKTRVGRILSLVGLILGCVWIALLIFIYAAMAS